MEASTEQESRTVPGDAAARRPARPALCPSSPDGVGVARTQLLASFGLAGSCLFWGLSFPLMPLACRGLESAAGPVGELGIAAAVNAIRFTLAALLSGFIAALWGSRPTRREVVGALAIGVPTAIGMFLQIAGLLWVLPSTSGILTALPVVFAPLAQFFILRRRVGGTVLAGVALALTGIGALCWRGASAMTAASQISAPPFPYCGEVATVAAALAFTAQILAVDRWGRACDVRSLTALCFAVQAALSAAIVPALGSSAALGPGLFAAARDVAWLANMGFLAAFCAVAAGLLMNACQPKVTPAHATVIYCLEPVFALLASLAFGQERLTVLTCAGGIVVVCAALTVNAPALLAAFGRQPRPTPDVDVAYPQEGRTMPTRGSPTGNEERAWGVRGEEAMEAQRHP